jgi:hypothetical protein
MVLSRGGVDGDVALHHFGLMLLVLTTFWWRKTKIHEQKLPMHGLMTTKTKPTFAWPTTPPSFLNPHNLTYSLRRRSQDESPCPPAVSSSGIVHRRLGDSHPWPTRQAPHSSWKYPCISMNTFCLRRRTALADSATCGCHDCFRQRKSQT